MQLALQLEAALGSMHRPRRLRVACPRRFNVTAPFYHDLSMEAGSLVNVASQGGGADLNLDLHRSAPFANLFTALALGNASRAFGAGGRKDRGAHAGGAGQKLACCVLPAGLVCC
jgi:hypothetical protein